METFSEQQVISETRQPETAQLTVRNDTASVRRPEVDVQQATTSPKEVEREQRWER